MNIAVALSGHLRFPNRTAKFWKHLDVDTYIHTWDDVIDSPYWENVDTPAQVDTHNVLRAHKPVGWIAENFEDRKQQMRDAVQPYLAWQATFPERRVGTPDQLMSNYARFRKMRMVSNMINYDDYDVVISSRSDFWMDAGEFHKFTSPVSGTIKMAVSEDGLGEGESDQRHFNLWFISGHPDDMKKILSIATRYDNLFTRAQNEDDPEGFFNPKRLMWEYINLLGISIDSVPVQFVPYKKGYVFTQPTSPNSGSI